MLDLLGNASHQWPDRRERQGTSPVWGQGQTTLHLVWLTSMMLSQSRQQVCWNICYTCLISVPTYVFWCARWMQLKIFPVSGSSLYILGYCKSKACFFTMRMETHQRVMKREHTWTKVSLWWRMSGWTHHSGSSGRRAAKSSDTHLHLVLLAGFANLPGQMSDHDHAGDACEYHIAVFLGKYNHLGSSCTRQFRGKQRHNMLIAAITANHGKRVHSCQTRRKTEIKQSYHMKRDRKTFHVEDWWLQTTAQGPA